MMLDYFKFCFGDAWCYFEHGDYGYRAILEKSPNGDHINWIIDGKIYIMDLSDRENEFMQLIQDCRMEKWNDKLYVNSNMLDGVRWEIIAGYSGSVNIKAMGINAFADSFKHFISMLHLHWNLPYARIDKDQSFPYRSFEKGVVVERLQL